MNFVAALALAGGLLMGASQAQATQFVGNWELKIYNNADPGLVVKTYSYDTNFDINLGAAIHTFDLFDLYTKEGSIEWDDVLNPKTVELKFTFESPENNNGPIYIGGETNGYSFLGIIQGGALTWANNGQAKLQWALGEPNLVTPGNMTISVNGGSFNEGWFGTDQNCNWKGKNCNPRDKGLLVQASFDWDNDPVFAPVSAAPEPTTWALMIGGFGLAGATLRRRRSLAVA
jgi:hypothetical protein